jgi:hypothetical protein
MLIITLFASATASFAAADKAIIYCLDSYPLVSLIQREKYLIWANMGLKGELNGG